MKDSTMGGVLVPKVMPDGTPIEDYVNRIVKSCHRGRAIGEICKLVRDHAGDCQYLSTNEKRRIFERVLGRA